MSTELRQRYRIELRDDQTGELLDTVKVELNESDRDFPAKYVQCQLTGERYVHRTVGFMSL